MNPRIWLSLAHMGGREQEFIQEAFDTNWVVPLGPNVDAFEKALAAYLAGLPGSCPEWNNTTAFPDGLSGDMPAALSGCLPAGISEKDTAAPADDELKGRVNMKPDLQTPENIDKVVNAGYGVANDRAGGQTDATALPDAFYYQKKICDASSKHTGGHCAETRPEDSSRGERNDNASVDSDRQQCFQGIGDEVPGRHVVALSAGTAALHLGLILLGVKEGDEVICQSFTFSASANPIIYQGATPVFVDSEPYTWNMDPVLLEEAIKDRMRKTGNLPKAILPVHLYGMPAQMDRICEVADRYGIPVLEDAAEALGSELNGRKCGTFGELAALSFNGNKMITTSGGGALVCRSEEEAARAKFYATQARDAAPHYQHSHIGYNYRMSNICAGIGRGQMFVLEKHVSRRRAIHELYTELLKDVPGISVLQNPGGRVKSDGHPGLGADVLDENAGLKTQPSRKMYSGPSDFSGEFQPQAGADTHRKNTKEMSGAFGDGAVSLENYFLGIRARMSVPAGMYNSNFWLTCILVDPQIAGCTREDIRLELDVDNIESRPLWKPMHLQPVFAGAPFYGNGTSERLFDTGLCLPSGPTLTDEDIKRVAGVIKCVVNSK